MTEARGDGPFGKTLGGGGEGKVSEGHWTRQPNWLKAQPKKNTGMPFGKFRTGLLVGIIATKQMKRVNSDAEYYKKKDVGGQEFGAREKQGLGWWGKSTATVRMTMPVGWTAREKALAGCLSSQDG